MTEVAARTRVAYAAPAFALAVVGIPLYVHVPKLYTDTVGVDIALVGWLLVLVRVFDAILDPLIGRASDRTRTRWGRRRPWIALAAAPLAVALTLLFVPRVEGAAAGAWFGAALFATFLFWTAITVPYESLGMELAVGFDERTSVLGLRDAALIAGTLAAASSPAIIGALLELPAGPAGDRARLGVMAAIYAPLLVVAAVTCAFFVRERAPAEEPVGATGLVGSLALLARNRPYVVVLLAYTVNAVGSNLPGALMKYYVEGYLGSTRTDVYLLAYFIAGIAFLPAWIALARRIGKTRAWIASMLVNAGAFGAVFFLGRDGERAYAVLVVLSGLGMGGTLALPSSIQADVVDYDELLTGARREGLLVGTWAVARKLAAAAGVGLALPLLGWAGYRPAAPRQAESVELALRVAYTLVPTVCSVAAIAIALLYPIDRERHERILEALRARRTGRPFEDPLGGGAA